MGIAKINSRKKNTGKQSNNNKDSKQIKPEEPNKNSK